MAGLPRDKILAALPRKGFIADNRRDHTYFHYVINGKKTGVSTKVSRGSKYKALDVTLQKKIQQQLKLDTLAELRDLVECPMGPIEYKQKLTDKGVKVL